MSRHEHTTHTNTGLHGSVSPKQITGDPAVRSHRDYDGDHQGPSPLPNSPIGISHNPQVPRTIEPSRNLGLQNIMNPSTGPTAIQHPPGPHTLPPPSRRFTGFSLKSYASSSRNAPPPSYASAPTHQYHSGDLQFSRPSSPRLYSRPSGGHSPTSTMPLPAIQPIPDRPMLQLRGVRNISSPQPGPSSAPPLAPSAPSMKRSLVEDPALGGPRQQLPVGYSTAGPCRQISPRHQPLAPARPDELQYGMPTYGPPQQDPRHEYGSAKRRRVSPPQGVHGPQEPLPVWHGPPSHRDQAPLPRPVFGGGAQGGGGISMDTSAYPFHVDTSSASKQADEKRMRNAGASARFRARKKEEKAKNEQELANLKSRVRDRDHMIRDLAGAVMHFENQLLRLRDIINSIPSARHFLDEFPPRADYIPIPAQIESLRNGEIQSILDSRNSDLQRSHSGQSNGSTNHILSPPAAAAAPGPAAGPSRGPPPPYPPMATNGPPIHSRPITTPTNRSPNGMYLHGQPLPPMATNMPQPSPPILASGPPSRQPSPNSRPLLPPPNPSYQSTSGPSRSPPGYRSSGSGSPTSTMNRGPIQDGSEPGFQSQLGGPEVRASTADWKNQRVWESDHHHHHHHHHHRQEPDGSGSK